MGLAIYLTRVDGNKEVVAIAGASELDSLWKPLIHTHRLFLLEQCVTAGLDIDPSTYDELCAEVKFILQEMTALRDDEDNPANPIFRCQRLLRILEEHPPSNDLEMYLG